jgi:hypothetical protein
MEKAAVNRDFEEKWRGTFIFSEKRYRRGRGTLEDVPDW